MRIGIDLVYIPSFKKKLEDSAFVRRIFHDTESADGRAEHLAGVFAAKEALFKAANQVSGWLDVEVRNVKGVPQLFAPQLSQHNIVLSITHERDYACAVVVVNENS